MLRGIHTSASGMLAQQHRLGVISNNLANITTTAYKRDNSIDKAFPELLIRKMKVDTIQFPYRIRHSTGSIDKATTVGVLGTGVEQNEIFTVLEQGALKLTENPTDVALMGEGFFVVDTPYGERYTRNGNFTIGNGNILMTKEGYPVLGQKGVIQLQENNFRIEEDGTIYVNANLREDLAFIDPRENDWRGEIVLDSFRVVDFEFPRYMHKQGDSLYYDTEYSGPAVEISGLERPRLVHKFLEASNVEPVSQMVEMIEVNRAYELGQKSIQVQDSSTNRLLSVRA